MKLSGIARALGLEVEGDDAEILALAGLDDAAPDDLSFATGPRYARAFERARAGAYLLPPGFDALGRPCLRSPTPYADFARAIELLLPAPWTPPPGVHPSAVVAADAELGADVAVGPLAVVGPRCRIGDRSVVHSHATLYADCEVGADCVIHSGAHLRQGTLLGDRVIVQNGVVLGSDGFGYAHRADGTRFLIPHRCPVELDDEVEVGANTTIDASHPAQGRHGHPDTRTRLGRGTKIDNLVQIAHGCAIGSDGTVCAQAGVAGSTTFGRSVLVAGQAAIAGHLEVGDGAMIGARAAVHSNVEPGAQLLGTPAIERRAFARWAAARTRLPELLRRVRAIEKHLGLGRGREADSEKDRT